LYPTQIKGGDREENLNLSGEKEKRNGGDFRKKERKKPPSFLP